MKKRFLRDNNIYRSKDDFARGYFCCVAALIEMDKGVETQTKELLNAYGGYNIKKWREWGVDEHDINIFKKYRKQII